MGKKLQPGETILDMNISGEGRRYWVFAGFSAPGKICVHYFIEGHSQPYAYFYSAMRGAVIDLPRNGRLAKRAFKISRFDASKNEIELEEWDGLEEEEREGKRVVRT